MSTISRKKPNSIDGRFSALQKAKNRHDSVPPAQDVLTAATVTRLDLIFPKYQTAMNDLAVAKAASGTSTEPIRLHLQKALCLPITSFRYLT